MYISAMPFLVFLQAKETTEVMVTEESEKGQHRKGNRQDGSCPRPI